MTRLKFRSSKLGNHIPSKKLQMRRQKFNDDFNCNKRYEQLGREESTDMKKGDRVTKVLNEDKSKTSSTYRIQRHPFEYFTSMASGIKTKNKELDLIRTNCISTNIRKHPLR